MDKAKVLDLIVDFCNPNSVIPKQSCQITGLISIRLISRGWAVSSNIDINKSNKADLIRQMLLKTVGKSPALFCYYVAIQEARELLGQPVLNVLEENNNCKPLRQLAEG